MSREHEYRPDGQLPAFNPIDGQIWTVIIRESKTEVIRKRGMGPRES